MSTEKRWFRHDIDGQGGRDASASPLTKVKEGRTRRRRPDRVVLTTTHLLNLIENLPAAVFIWKEGREILHNSRAAAMLSNEQGRASGLMSMLSELDQGRVSDLLAAAQRGEQPDPLIARIHARWLELSFGQLQVDIGRVVITMCWNISARRQLEMHLAAHDRMATIGTLAAGVAHEINNPMCFIQLNLELLREELPQIVDSALRGDVGQIERIKEVMARLEETIVGTVRVQEVVSDLMVFSHTETHPEVGSAELIGAIKLAMNLGRHRVKHTAKLCLQGPPDLMVRGQIGLLSQVFLNLIINATDAIESSDVSDGRINITVQQTHAHVEILVEDNGPGIPVQAMSQIFQPFFTSKKVGEGSGLGLAISRNIINRFGGGISAENAADGGARFRVLLPLAGTRTASPPRETDRNTGRPQLLIVDDEEMLLRALQRGLSADFEVITAQSGCQAIELVENGLEPDLILLDVMIPDLDGSEVFNRLCIQAPMLQGRIMLMTGGAVTNNTQQFLEQTPARIFQKPLKIKELRKYIRSVVDKS